jgi:hypothetical protein
LELRARAREHVHGLIAGQYATHPATDGRYYNKAHATTGERHEGWTLDTDLDTNDRVEPCRAAYF